MKKRTRAQLHQAIEDAMRSALFWSIFSYRNGRIKAAVVEYQRSVILAGLLDKDTWADVAIELCDTHDVDFNKWQDAISGQFTEYLTEGMNIKEEA